MKASKKINTCIQSVLVILLSLIMASAWAMPPKKSDNGARPKKGHYHNNYQSRQQYNNDLERAKALSVSEQSAKKDTPKNNTHTSYVRPKTGHTHHSFGNPDRQFEADLKLALERSEADHKDQQTLPRSSTSSSGSYHDSSRTSSPDGAYGITHNDDEDAFFKTPAKAYSSLYNNSDSLSSDEEDAYDENDGSSEEENDDSTQLLPNEKFRKAKDSDRQRAISSVKRAISKEGLKPEWHYSNWNSHIPRVSQGVKGALNSVFLTEFTDSEINIPRDANDNYLRNQVISYSVKAKLGADWQPLSGSGNSFFLANAGLPNIGEKPDIRKCPDAKAFSDKGRFRHQKFQRSVQKHFVGILRHAKSRNISHFVLVPESGQGAFIKYADKHFTRGFSEDTVRDAYINGFMDAWKIVSPSFTVYLTGGSKNVDLWQQPLSAIGINCVSKARGDALMVAQNLANTYPHQRTLLFNAANNRGPGNCFTHNGARIAMDENYHRRFDDASIVTVFIIDQGPNTQAERRKIPLLQHIKTIKRLL
ncbi:hypothetical protein CI610_00213 [invertebrate metagenome]|uniref:Uncharacterized protein n=1 Tax=invertebrate metagenome TaxID=1711999 RepID=A0A2H9TCF1_9ZZZZ